MAKGKIQTKFEHSRIAGLQRGGGLLQWAIVNEIGTSRTVIANFIKNLVAICLKNK